MSLPAGLDRASLRALEVHETRVHARPRREIRDLGDALMLFDPEDREPFWNRVSCIEWPRPGNAFDRRLADTLALFGSLDRIPHIWPPQRYPEPPDLVSRLLRAGFEDLGGGQLMVLEDPEPSRRIVAARAPRATTVERLTAPAAADRDRLADDVALVLGEAFDVEPEKRARMAADTAVGFDLPDQHICLARVDGEPAAIARRTTFDGASYLSAIGTRPAYRGRGLGRLVTAFVTADGVTSGSRWVYLGVFEDNEPAFRLYEGLGFEVVGAPSPDLVLR
ncbi:MAG TPA: N-acetyltransferase [Candidatus Limnocylindrales bacterium]|jgi:ribosomal protein S18 acetylase RimI-like enzyme